MWRTLEFHHSGGYHWQAFAALISLRDTNRSVYCRPVHCKAASAMLYAPSTVLLLGTISPLEPDPHRNTSRRGRLPEPYRYTAVELLWSCCRSRLLPHCASAHDTFRLPSNNICSFIFLQWSGIPVSVAGRSFPCFAVWRARVWRQLNPIPPTTSHKQWCNQNLFFIGRTFFRHSLRA